MNDDTPPLGLESGTARVVPYDPRWPRLFEQTADELRVAAGTNIISVHHVGSTSVAGLAAKPILDLLLAIPEFERGRELFPILASMDYEYRPDPDIPDRHYFRRRIGTVRTHHLSLAEPESHYFRVTIAFRDALRADAELAAEYGELKRDLAERFPRDREAYTSGKTEFVRRVLAQSGLSL